jgi:hypothetical protein
MLNHQTALKTLVAWNRCLERQRERDEYERGDVLFRLPWAAVTFVKGEARLARSNRPS